MNITEAVKIGGYNHKVERPTEPFVCDGTICDGTYDFTKQVIKVAQAGSQAYQNTVFLHEICHGVVENYCRGNDNYNEEKFVEQFAKGLYQVINDNPEIFAM